MSSINQDVEKGNVPIKKRYEIYLYIFKKACFAQQIFSNKQVVIVKYSISFLIFSREKKKEREKIVKKKCV